MPDSKYADLYNKDYAIYQPGDSFYLHDNKQEDLIFVYK